MLDFLLKCLDKKPKNRFSCEEAIKHPLIDTLNINFIVKKEGLELKKSLFTKENIKIINLKEKDEKNNHF